MSNIGSWVTAATYFATAYSCQRTSTYDLASQERYFWVSIAITLGALGIVELIDLPAIIADFSRSTAKESGWYGQREFYQVRLIYLAAVATTVVVLALLLVARRTSVQCETAVVVTSLIVGYIIVRAVSLHSIDTIMGWTMLGLHFNRVPEIAGIGIILSVSAWRMFR